MPAAKVPAASDSNYRLSKVWAWSSSVVACSTIAISALRCCLRFYSIRLSCAQGSRSRRLSYAFGLRQEKNGFISIKNVLTRQRRCYTFEFLDGETLATISFEELCAERLVRGDESCKRQPGWGEPGKAAAIAGASQIRVDWRGRSIFFCSFFAVRGAIELLDLSFSRNANPRKFSSATLVESAAWIFANLYLKAGSYSTTFRDIFPSYQSGAIQSYFFSIIIDLSPSNIT
jgi:hypothetical protein